MDLILHEDRVSELVVLGEVKDEPELHASVRTDASVSSLQNLLCI